MVDATFLSSPFFVELVLPFLLIFTLIFAILEKTGILGEDKKQVNAIVGFVVGLILIAFPSARGLIINLIPFLAVVAVVLLIFLLLYGFVGGESGEKWMKITFAILIGIALIIALLYFTNWWDFIVSGLGGEQGQKIAANVFFVVVIVAAIAIVLSTGKKKSSE